MIRTNSKLAMERIKAYIIENYTPDNYGEEEQNAATLPEISAIILNDVKRVEVERVKAGRFSWQDAFCEWAAGLPSILDTCYYYNRSAVDDLGEILDETEEEKARYTEAQAERTLSYLIFRELTKAAPDILR